MASKQPKNSTLVITASSKEKAEQMLNKYYYSTTYKISDNGDVTFKDGEIRKNLKAIPSGKRWRIYRIDENSTNSYKNKINEISDEASVKRDAKRKEILARQKEQKLTKAKQDLYSAKKQKTDFDNRANDARNKLKAKLAKEKEQAMSSADSAIEAARKKLEAIKAKRNK